MEAPSYHYYHPDPYEYQYAFDATALPLPPSDPDVQWDWTAAPPPARILAPAPIYPDAPYFAIKEPLGLRSPPQLPTPAAMAILLQPHAQAQAHGGRSEGEPSPSAYDIPPGSAIVAHQALAAIPPRPAEPAVTSQLQLPESLSREKKHACTMCHKRFDRPSTLRKHLLVHTGEKAFVCDTCGRRFGVASNLNRHVKRCITKPVNTPSPASPDSTTMSHSPRAPKRTRTTTSSPPRPSPTASNSNDISPTLPKSKPPAQKRRRRAPSPSQWVPATLHNFKLVSEDSYETTLMPLSPVRRNLPREERDSWDENVALNPYHPLEWAGVLPGPGLAHGHGLGGKDVRNLNLGGRGGHMLGRLPVF